MVFQESSIGFNRIGKLPGQVATALGWARIDRAMRYHQLVTKARQFGIEAVGQRDLALPVAAPAVDIEPGMADYSEVLKPSMLR